MGINLVGASILKDKNSPFNEFKYIGLSVTCSADKLITDSAAAATALATGYLTNNKFISVDPEGKVLNTIFEHAEILGLATGLVVTSTVSHATPGAFVAHSSDRYNQDTIALQMVNNNIDVVIGGGLKYFLPIQMLGSRDDGKNLISELQKKNYQILKTYEELVSLPDTLNQYFALLEPDALPDASDRSYSLGDLTKKAIISLSKNKNGFILMVEASKIDWGAHDKKPKQLFNELDDFTTAVKEALNFAKIDSNTLVLVTADHETGGISINNVDQTINEIETVFTTNGHTPALTPILAFGKRAEVLTGIMKINDIGRKLFQLLDPSVTF